MPDRRRRVRDLIQEVLDERAHSIGLSPEEIETGVTQLRRMFRAIEERAAAQQQADHSPTTTLTEASQGLLLGGRRRLRYEAVLRPGTYRLRLGDLSFRVILGEAQQTSRILLDAARDLLTSAPGAWHIVRAAAPVEAQESPSKRPATRSEAEDRLRVEIVQQAGSATGTVIADDTGERPRVRVEIRGFPAGQSVPILELGEERPETEHARAIHVDPEVSPEQEPGSPGRPRK
jgi:hypothetical protein